MPDNTLIAVLPDGTTAERRTLRNYVSAVVYRRTEAEAVAAEEELERARAAVTSEQRAEWENLMVDFREARVPVTRALEEYTVASAIWKERMDRGEEASYPKMPSNDLWKPVSRLSALIRKHPLYLLEYVDGMTEGPTLVHLANEMRASIGEVGVTCWNQRLELSHSSAEAERARHPYREIQVVLTSVKEVKRRVKA